MRLRHDTGNGTGKGEPCRSLRRRGNGASFSVPETTLAAAARAVVPPESEIRAVSPAMGPVPIEGCDDDAFFVPGLLEEIAEANELGLVGHDLARFDDPGPDAALELARAPVVGVVEAAMHMATLVAGSSTIVTTLSRAVPTIEQLTRKCGFVRHSRKVREVEFPVLAFEEPGSPARDLAAAFGLPVIDGVAAATELVGAIVGPGLRTSKIGAFAPPPPETYTGAFAGFAPRRALSYPRAGFRSRSRP